MFMKSYKALMINPRMALLLGPYKAFLIRPYKASCIIRVPGRHHPGDPYKPAAGGQVRKAPQLQKQVWLRTSQ